MIYLINENWFTTIWQGISTNDINLLTTIIIAVATVLYVRYTYRLVKINASQLDEKIRPYIVVSFRQKDRRVSLVVKNIGQRPAYNIDINITPSLEKIILPQMDMESYKPMLNQKFMPPDFEVSNFISTDSHIVKNTLYNEVFNITVNYEDIEGEKYPPHEYKINLSGFIFPKNVRETSIKKHVENIDNAIQQLALLKEIEVKGDPYSDTQ